MSTSRRQRSKEPTGSKELCIWFQSRISHKILLSLNKEVRGFCSRILNNFIQESTGLLHSEHAQLKVIKCMFDKERWQTHFGADLVHGHKAQVPKGKMIGENAYGHAPFKII